MMAVGRRAAHLVSYRIARKVNDPKYVGILLKKRIDPVFQYLAYSARGDYNFGLPLLFLLFQWIAE
jgi:hypothetical protein